MSKLAKMKRRKHLQQQQSIFLDIIQECNTNTQSSLKAYATEQNY